MGAHLLDRLAQEVSDELAQVLPGRAVTGIVSNRPVGRAARAVARVPVADLARAGRSGAEVAADVEVLCRWAVQDEFRRPTHLKGALNGVFAVLRAFAQDDRAVAASLVSTAQADPGAVLPRWRVEEDLLLGEFSMPLPVGITGLALDRPPWSILGRLAGVVRATDLEELAVAVGLTQNLAALQTLVSEGIVRGHGVLHARRGRGQC
jgi:hydroxymethylglutaryl-CoA reductase